MTHNNLLTKSLLLLFHNAKAYDPTKITAWLIKSLINKKYLVSWPVIGLLVRKPWIVLHKWMKIFQSFHWIISKRCIYHDGTKQKHYNYVFVGPPIMCPDIARETSLNIPHPHFECIWYDFTSDSESELI